MRVRMISFRVVTALALMMKRRLLLVSAKMHSWVRTAIWGCSPLHNNNLRWQTNDTTLSSFGCSDDMILPSDNRRRSCRVRNSSLFFELYSKLMLKDKEELCPAQCFAPSHYDKFDAEKGLTELRSQLHCIGFTGHECLLLSRSDDYGSECSSVWQI